MAKNIESVQCITGNRVLVIKDNCKLYQVLIGVVGAYITVIQKRYLHFFCKLIEQIYQLINLVILGIALKPEFEIASGQFKKHLIDVPNPILVRGLVHYI